MISVRNPVRRCAVHAAAFVTMLICGAAVGEAQQAGGVVAHRGTMLTRADLESLHAEAVRAGDEHGRLRAAAIESRLREGDFAPGDRIVVAVAAITSRSDTLTVRGDRSVEVPEVARVSLVGVLRSELRAHMDSAVAHYLRNARVDAVALLRMSVSGQVVRPGFYSFTPEMLLSDAVMAAGGPTPQADLARLEIRRDGGMLYPAQFARDLVSRGFTLDGAGLRSGDELHVSARRGVSQATIIGWVTAIGSAIALVATVAR